ncbi:MAG: hypothetical protein HY307_03320 [Arcobacter sp.]|nr:hypothetical protein [Arcobacter sp.]
MFDDTTEITAFRKTLKQVVKDLETVTDISIGSFKSTVLEQFDRYSYEGEDEVVGFETWEDISQNGKYQLMVRINHEDAYIFTIFVVVQDGLITVEKVL